MFGFLMLASFALIIISQHLPEKQVSGNKKQEAQSRKKQRPAKPVGRANHCHRTTTWKIIQPCRNGFSRAV